MTGWLSMRESGQDVGLVVIVAAVVVILGLAYVLLETVVAP